MAMRWPWFETLGALAPQDEGGDGMPAPCGEGEPRRAVDLWSVLPRGRWIVRSSGLARRADEARRDVCGARSLVSRDEWIGADRPLRLDAELLCVVIVLGGDH